MPCYHPIPASQDGPGLAVRLNPPVGEGNLSLPCGTCLGCRTTRALEWAHRCTHEASSWEANCFVTLTYADEHLPALGHLDARAFSLFAKRLRRLRDRRRGLLAGDHGYGVRYFACGEYGSRLDRPHYHALLFNCGFRDLRMVGAKLFESDILSELWPFGKHAIGSADPAAANYIAQYSLKKSAGPWERAYSGGPVRGEVNRETGEWRPSPFLRMSLKPAIGYSWLDRFPSDLSQGFMVVAGRKARIPRGYKKALAVRDPLLSEAISFRGYKHSSVATDANSPERLHDAEIIHQRRKQLSEDSRCL